MSNRVFLVSDDAFESGPQTLPSIRNEGAIRCKVEIRAVAEANGSSLRIGFIGLNQVGMKMALRLLQAGLRLTVFDADPENLQALASAGASVANRIADACFCANVVFTMLPDDETVEAVVLGPDGVIESMARNAIHIGTSSISLECSDRIVEAHWDAGQRYISAPLLGGSGLSADDVLCMIAGGAEEVIAEVRPLLDAIGQVAAELDGWPTEANAVQLTRILCS